MFFCEFWEIFETRFLQNTSGRVFLTLTHQIFITTWLICFCFVLAVLMLREFNIFMSRIYQSFRIFEVVQLRRYFSLDSIIGKSSLPHMCVCSVKMLLWKFLHNSLRETCHMESFFCKDAVLSFGKKTSSLVFSCNLCKVFHNIYCSCSGEYLRTATIALVGASSKLSDILRSLSIRKYPCWQIKNV